MTNKERAKIVLDDIMQRRGISVELIERALDEAEKRGEDKWKALAGELIKVLQIIPGEKLSALSMWLDLKHSGGGNEVQIDLAEMAIQSDRVLSRIASLFPYGVGHFSLEHYERVLVKAREAGL